MAAAGDGAAARTAMEELCRVYWLPLYAFARRQGCSPQDAEDHTQVFLSQVVSTGLLAKVAGEGRRLRTCLLAAFQNDLIDAHRRASRVKRGGGVSTVSLDALQAEQLLGGLPSETSPVDAYDRLWAMSTLEAAVTALERQYAERGQASLFQALRLFLDPSAGADYAAAMAATGLDGGSVRQAVFRLRQRFRVLLRETIADTLVRADEELIDEELAVLRGAMRG